MRMKMATMKMIAAAARGCSTGVKILVANAKLRDAMLKSPTIEGCRHALSAENYITLEESGYRLIAEGAAGFDEVEKTIA